MTRRPAPPPSRLGPQSGRQPGSHDGSKKRSGRPVLGKDEAGRARVLEGARTLLRQRMSLNVSRQQIAREAGVTPALITYYFPDQADLLIEASYPVLREALDGLLAILESSDDFRTRLERVVANFIGFAAAEAHLLDVYVQVAHTTRHAHGLSFVTEAMMALTRFFADGARAGAWRDFEPTVFVFALWGMCKFVGETPVFAIRMFPDPTDSALVRRRQAEALVDLLLHGIGPQGR